MGKQQVKRGCTAKGKLLLRYVHVFSWTHYGGGAFEFWSAEVVVKDREKEKDTENGNGNGMKIEKESPKWDSFLSYFAEISSADAACARTKKHRVILPPILSILCIS